MTKLATWRGARGFTLIEAVIVIVVIGIIAAIVALFIRLPVQSYVDNAARAELVDIADSALRRMAREVRISLPNSVRIASDGAGGQFIEMLETSIGGRYLSDDDIGAGSGSPLSFSDSTKRTFTVIGALPTLADGSQMINAGQFIVVYNLFQDTVNTQSNAYAGTNRAQIASLNTGANTITLTTNPFASSLPSPVNRFQVVTGAVSYHCNPATGQIVRFANYSITLAQRTTDSGFTDGTRSILATNVTACNFSSASAAGTHTAVLTMSLSLRGTSTNSGTVSLQQDVHVDNTP